MSNSPARGGWKHNAGSVGGASPGVRRTIALVALLAAAGGVAGLWYWISPPAPIRFVIVPVAEYTDPAWPPNPWAARDSAALVALFPTEEAERAFTFQERERFVSLLKSLQAEKTKPVVMHITALGETRDGSVYILPGHAKPDDVLTWLPLSELLVEFGKCESKKKLLILDIATSLADPFRGPTNDEVAARLHEQLSKATLPFFVLTSCSAGELAQPMTAAQATAFGYYVAEGLRGAADGYDGGARDGRVSVRDLAAFTAARVNRWATRNCSVSQTPALYGSAADFALMFESRGAPEAPGPRAYPAWLLEAWQARDASRDSGAYRVAPSAFTAAEAAILRAERLWIAGAEAAALRRIAAVRDEYRTRVDAERPVRPVPIRSLIVAQGGKPVPPDMATALETLLRFKPATPPAKPDVLHQQAIDAFTAKAKAAPNDATAAIWSSLVRDPEPSPERIKQVTDLLLDTQPSPFTESLLAQRLVAWQPRSIPWPAMAVHSLLLAEDALGRSLALAPAAFPWIDKLLAAAATKYREGEAMLFDAKTLNDVRVAKDRLTAAESDLRAVRQQWEVVQATQLAVADGTLLLLETAEPMIEGHRFDEAQWRAAAGAATALAESLAKTPNGRELPLTEWEARLQNARRAFAPFQTDTSPKAVKDLLALPEPPGVEWLLQGPWLGAANRAAAWTAQSRRMHRLHDETVALDRVDDEARQPTRAAKATGDAAAPERAARRAHVSADLLRLAGLEGDATPSAWLVRLPAARAERIAKQDWIGASRLDRVAVFGDDRGGRSPASRQLRAEEQLFRQWLADWYGALGQLRATVPRATEFCDAAAADVRQPPRD